MSSIECLVLQLNLTQVWFYSEDEVIKKNAREKVLLINRIFPIARDFDFLLNNKFET